MPLPARLAIATVTACALLTTSAQAVACPGATPACPYTATSAIGQRGEGVLRFPQAIAVGADGSVYVGDQGSHAVQVFDAQGRFQRDIGSAGTKPGQLTGVGALALAGDGTLLVADGANRIDRFATDGSLLGSFGSSGTQVGQFRFGGGRGNDAGAGGGLAASGQTVYVADSGNDRLQRFTLDGERGAEIVAPGTLAHPKGIAVRGSRLFVADDQNHRVLVMDTGGRILGTIGTGNGSKPGQLNFPYGVALDPAGRVFVADNINQRISRFSTGPSYLYKARFGSYGARPGELAYPRGIATDAAGNLYVTNTGNNRIDVFDRSGAVLRTFGRSGRDPGQFGKPLGLAADASGTRAVVDSVNGRVQMLAPDGTVRTAWGSPAPGPTVLPRAVAVVFDAAGNAYVLDQRRARIVVFDRATGLPSRTIGSQGSGPGKLRDPSALAIDAAGVISVADAGNQRIARFTARGQYRGAQTGVGAARGIAVTPDGARTYLAVGNAIIAYDPQGRELTRFGGLGRKLGKLSSPAQLALDAAGNLWVADRGNHRVQQFGPDGERLVSFGERGTGAGQFVHPTGVSVDCNGLLTVSDSDNNRVQQFALAAPAAAGCASLAPLASPAAPRLPTLPAPDGPILSVRPLRTSGLLSSRTLPVRIGCDTTCAITATVQLTVRRKLGRRGGKAVKPTAVTVRVPALTVPGGESRIVRVRLSARHVAVLRRQLKGTRGMSANLQVVGRAATGAPTPIVQRFDATA